MIQLKVWLLRAEEIKAQLIFFQTIREVDPDFFSLFWKYTLGQNSNFLQNRNFSKWNFGPVWK